MLHRYVSSISALAAGIAIALLAPLADGQAPTAAKTVKTFTPPKTPWGDPDLQGVWPGTSMIGTPLERDRNLGTRTVLNDAEYAVRLSRRQAEEEFDTAETVSEKTRCDPSSPGGRIPGVDRGPNTGYVSCGANGTTIGPPLYWDERGKPNRQASLVVDPPDGRLPALTPPAQKSVAERAAIARQHVATRGATDTWEDRSLQERCISFGPSGFLPAGYDSGNQIVQAPGYVVIRIEKIHEARIIPLDSRPHTGSTVRSWMGDARGHWEGNTLVVETTNFNGKSFLGGTPVSDSLREVERFSLVDAKTLKYELTVEDHKTWTKPWTASFNLARDNNYSLYEYACHEGNYAMYDTLKGARTLEQTKAETNAAGRK